MLTIENVVVQKKPCRFMWWGFYMLNAFLLSSCLLLCLLKHVMHVFCILHSRDRRKLMMFAAQCFSQSPRNLTKLYSVIRSVESLLYISLNCLSWLLYYTPDLQKSVVCCFRNIFITKPSHWVTTAKQVSSLWGITGFIGMVWACVAKRRQWLGEDVYGVWSGGFQTKRYTTEDLEWGCAKRLSGT